MRVTVTLEHRFRMTPDGKLWSQTMFPYTFWNRYLEVFEHVNIVARALKVHSIPDNWNRADGDGVSFTPVPYYVGPLQYLLKARKVKQTVRNSPGPKDAIIMRVGSQLAQCLEPELRRQRRRPYGVEVVGDPYEVYAPGAMKHPLRPFLRWWKTHKLRHFCRNACAAAYVTEFSLQKRYPPGPETFPTHYSSVELPDEAFASDPRVSQNKKTFNLVHVGTMSQMYKAQDVLIDAVSICVQEGINLRLTLIGDGKHRNELESQAKSAGLNGRGIFTGQLPKGDAVRMELDKADLFVLPSKTEGLPRSMIEAMARGLPSVGSSAGGIPELLKDEEMVSPGNPEALARKVQEIISNPERMRKMSVRNFQKAVKYKDDVVSKRRHKFYRVVKDRTERWLCNV